MQNKPHILVIGDIMLDQYVAGKVTRISPEAPVPVVKVDKEWSTLGGAANVAANVVALGGVPILFGLVGNDAAGQAVLTACDKAEIQAVLTKTNQPTIVKTRVVSGQQIVRFDREELFVWCDEKRAELQHNLKLHISACKLVLVSDYAKGTLSKEVLKLVFELAREARKPVLVDPKQEDWTCYEGAFLLTPNLVELEMTKAGKGITNDDNQVVEACNQLRTDFSIENIVATRSSYGMTVCSQRGVLNIPTRAQEVYDVSGAGDTVLAAFGVSLAEGNLLSESAFFANAAAGIVVSKQGTAVVNRSVLDQFLKADTKLVSRKNITRFREESKGQKVIFTNGCFDVLHQGHRKLLADAKKHGDLLVIGLNSDDSISRLKGADRPINNWKQRVDALSALPSVDAIIIFEEDTPFEVLEELKPNVLVKGGDYRAEEIVGNQLVKEVVIIPLVEGLSTTKLMSRVSRSD